VRESSEKTTQPTPVKAERGTSADKSSALKSPQKPSVPSGASKKSAAERTSKTADEGSPIPAPVTANAAVSLSKAGRGSTSYEEVCLEFEKEISSKAKARKEEKLAAAAASKAGSKDRDAAVPLPGKADTAAGPAATGSAPATEPTAAAGPGSKRADGEPRKKGAKSKDRDRDRDREKERPQEPKEAVEPPAVVQIKAEVAALADEMDTSLAVDTSAPVTAAPDTAPTTSTATAPGADNASDGESPVPKKRVKIASPQKKPALARRNSTDDTVAAVDALVIDPTKREAVEGMEGSEVSGKAAEEVKIAAEKGEEAEGEARGGDAGADEPTTPASALVPSLSRRSSGGRGRGPGSRSARSQAEADARQAQKQAEARVHPYVRASQNIHAVREQFALKNVFSREADRMRAVNAVYYMSELQRSANEFVPARDHSDLSVFNHRLLLQQHTPAVISEQLLLPPTHDINQAVDLLDQHVDVLYNCLKSIREKQFMSEGMSFVKLSPLLCLYSPMLTTMMCVLCRRHEGATRRSSQAAPGPRHFSGLRNCCVR
jgi:hypothetical protein